MKKIFFLFVLFGISIAFLENRRTLTIVSAQTDAPNAVQFEKDRRLADKIREITVRTTDDLPEKIASDGEVSIDLEDRFQNVMLSRVDSDGEPAAACVTSVDEANAFYGKDLVTGAPVSSAQYRKDKTQNTANNAAAYDGISDKEFEFYKNLIEQAAARRANSPTAATIAIVNGDGAGEGFNDATARAPEGNNNGATLGEQRLNLFNFAAAIWGAYLDTSVTINVNSQFNPLTCSATSAVLGSAGATSISRDFPNAPLAGTWYHTALAAKLSGADRNGATAEINATFNSEMDSGNCLGGRTFYYGLDNATPSGKTNLLVVLLHEMGHGLGFAGSVNGTTGQLAGSDANGRFPDIFTRFMFDRTTGKYWYQMTDAERVTSSLNNGNVLWDGGSVRVASGAMTNGRDTSNGRVQLFTPITFQSGSSISHFDTAAFPNLLMEPNITSGLPLTLDLTRQEMRDIGWYRDSAADLTPDTITSVQPSSGNLAVGSSATVTWANNGGFNRNVSIELSTNGGTTYTILASNVANTGSYSFTVPNSATTQGRIRVREYDFVEPAGVTAANFSIGTTTAVNKTKFDFDGDGRADISVFRPSNGGWYIQKSGSGFYGENFGAPVDKAVSADYDGDGKTDIAVYRSGAWYLQRSRDGFYGINWGAAEDIPVPADYDGDGQTDIAVYRPSTGSWYIYSISTGQFTGYKFGAAEDKPVAADYDGDGRTDIAVFRPSEAAWYVQRSRDGFFGAYFGESADNPIPADYDGDGKADVAVYRPANGSWYLQTSRDGFKGYQYGAVGDLPIPADYDGDGKTDIGVFRPSEGAWYIQRTKDGFQGMLFGAGTDKPTPNSFIR